MCVCCHRMLCDSQVVELDDDWQETLENQYPGSVSRFIGPIPPRNVYFPCSKGSKPEKLVSNHFCHNCKKYVERNLMPPMCNQNNLQFFDTSKFPELKLSELEQQLVSLNLLFQKIVLLPKSQMNALKDKTVSVPIETSDVLETLTRLPRTPSDAGLSVVQLKRRLNYPGVHNQQLINICNVVKALQTFVKLGNPHYADILEDEQFKERCRETDPDGFRILFPDEKMDSSSSKIDLERNKNIDETKGRLNNQNTDTTH